MTVKQQKAKLLALAEAGAPRPRAALGEALDRFTTPSLTNGEIRNLISRINRRLRPYGERIKINRRPDHNLGRYYIITDNNGLVCSDVRLQESARKLKLGCDRY